MDKLAGWVIVDKEGEYKSEEPPKNLYRDIFRFGKKFNKEALNASLFKIKVIHVNRLANTNAKISFLNIVESNTKKSIII